MCLGNGTDVLNVIVVVGLWRGVVGCGGLLLGNDCVVSV